MCIRQYTTNSSQKKDKNCKDLQSLQLELLTTVMRNDIERARFSEDENGGYFRFIIFHN